MSIQQFDNQMYAYDSLPRVSTSQKVFKIALIGSSIALIGAIISLVFVIIAYSISVNIKAPREYRSGLEAVLFYAVLGVVIGVVFTSLTVLLRKMKSKAPAIVFGTLITLSNCSVIPGVISLGGWSTLLVSGIMGVKISPEELHMNKHL